MEFKRLRKYRNKEYLRDLVSEFNLSVKGFIMPCFVVEGKDKKEEIASMEGIYRFSINRLLKEVEEIQNLGIPAVLLFGVLGNKNSDEVDPMAYSDDGIVQKAVKKIRQKFPRIVIITDVCLCGYTSHGHCGIIKNSKSKIKNARLQNQNYIIDNDSSIALLGRIALSHAEAGADIVAPSAMMDGQVLTIRKTLDDKGFKNVGVMGYSAKYSSSFYGPFREAVQSSPRFGDRKTYQMDFRNLKEALREVEADIAEGADIVMVKPALAYLDVIRAVNEKFNIPVAAYSVSGEYSMVRAYCRMENSELKIQNLEKNLVLEILTGIKRAGADIIINYWAKKAAEWIQE